MLKVSVEARGIVAALEQLPREIAIAGESGLDSVAELALQQKQREISKTYRRTIPRGKGGKPKWQRSGNWQNEQRIESKAGERVIVATGESAGYEAKLADLPTGKDAVNRSNPAAQNARAVVEKSAVALMETALKKALNL